MSTQEEFYPYEVWIESSIHYYATRDEAMEHVAALTALGYEFCLLEVTAPQTSEDRKETVLAGDFAVTQ